MAGHMARILVLAQFKGWGFVPTSLLLQYLISIEPSASVRRWQRTKRKSKYLKSLPGTLPSLPRVKTVETKLT